MTAFWGMLGGLLSKFLAFFVVYEKGKQEGAQQAVVEDIIVQQETEERMDREKPVRKTRKTPEERDVAVSDARKRLRKRADGK